MMLVSRGSCLLISLVLRTTDQSKQNIEADVDRSKL